jgi:UDP-N-acetylglucosamine transferase subunit ALG13
MGTNDYPFDRLYRYISEEPLYRDKRCEWFVQSGVVEITTPPACGEVAALVPRDKMEALVRQSALVISHCGIGSLNLMLKYRKRTIFVPRVSEHGEFSDDHQLQIAREINNPRINLVYPEDPFPPLDYQSLCAETESSTPVDITNYDLARIVEYKLTG